jgi:N6-adenosine-specific RNA methylase IME4
MTLIQPADPAISIVTPFVDLHGCFGTILADPPWRFTNRTGKIAPEHKRLSRYGTMTLDEIMALPVARLAAATAHLYLWCPNALLPDGLALMAAWGFAYKSNIVWYKIRADGGPDGRGVGFYFRNVTELILFGVRGANARTLALIEACSSGPFLELFARGSTRPGWVVWGDEASVSFTEAVTVTEADNARLTDGGEP